MGSHDRVPVADGEKRYYDVFEALPDGVLIADDSGAYVYANGAALEIAGRTLEELLALTIADVAPDGYSFAEVWGEFRQGGTLSGDFELLRGDGTTVTVEFRARADFLPGRHLSVIRDVSDRRRIEQHLRRSEDRYIRAFTKSPVAKTIRVLSTGVVVDVNDEFLRLTGLYRAAVVGRTAETLGIWDDPQSMVAALAELRSGGGRTERVGGMRSRSGERMNVRLIALRTDIGGEPHAISAYIPLG